MRYFYDQHTGLYVFEVNKNIPKTAVELTKDQYQEVLAARSSGGSVRILPHGGVSIVPINNIEYLIEASEERSWRNSELLRADVELNKTQDSDPKAIGSVTQWRDYRRKLRNWPENKDFPEKESRPKSPDSKE